MFDYEGAKDERETRSPALVAGMETVLAQFKRYRGYRFEDIAGMSDVRRALIFPGFLDQILGMLVRDYAIVREVQWSGIWYSRISTINGGCAKVRNSRGVSFRVGNRARVLHGGWKGTEGVVIEVDPSRDQLAIALSPGVEAGFRSEDMELL